MPRTPQHLCPLTERQLQIVRMSATLSNAKIGRAMGITAATVAVHLDGAKLKLGALTKKEVVEVARRRGLM